MFDCIFHIIKDTEKNILNLEHERAESKNGFLIEKILHEFLEKDETKYFVLKQKIARISNVIASALSEHDFYHNNVVNTSLVISRGCLNIGVELCENPIESIEHVGIEYVFKLGFNAIIELQKRLLTFLYDKKFISSKDIKLAQKWLHSDQFKYSSEIFLCFDGLLNFIPLSHEDLFKNYNKLNQETAYLSQKFKPFEHKSEIVSVQTFLDNIEINLQNYTI